MTDMLPEFVGLLGFVLGATLGAVAGFALCMLLAESVIRDWVEQRKDRK